MSAIGKVRGKCIRLNWVNWVQREKIRIQKNRMTDDVMNDGRKKIKHFHICYENKILKYLL